MTDKLIAHGFPFLDVSRLAKLESYRKNIYRPPYYIHKWWARRNGTAFRALVLASLLDDDQDLSTAFYERHDFSDVTLLDPFMGGGTTVGEALRLGCRVVGSDINPVAWFLVRKAVEEFNVNDLDGAMTQLEMTVAPEIRELYQTECKLCSQPSEAIYTYWVKVIPCGNCEQDVELRTGYVLARYAQDSSRGLICCPECGDLNVVAGLGEKAECPSCRFVFATDLRNSQGAKYVCPHCSSTGQIIDVMRTLDVPPEHRMVGMFYLCPQHGRLYKGAIEEDLARYKEISNRVEREWDELLIPRSTIPAGYNTNQMIRYNYRRWSQMFNDRQLLALSTLGKGIRTLENEQVRGYLALLMSSLLEFNSMFTACKGLGTGAVRHVFAHHAFIPQKEPLETNLWGATRASGSFATLYEERLKRGKRWCLAPVERRVTDSGVEKVAIEGESLSAQLVEDWDELEDRGNALLLNIPSDSLPIPDQSIDLVITDPPYFDNVMYSELADYFYVWLRLMLADQHGEFGLEHAARGAEVIKNTTQNKDAAFYQAGLESVFKECHRVLRDSGRLVFTFHHGSKDAWDAVGHALAGAGFGVETFHPLHSEMDVGVPIQGKKGIKFDVVFVCRKNEHLPASEIDAEDYVRELTVELETEFSVTDADFQVFREAARTMAITRSQ